ncbi:MAG: hypothetical protein LIP16_03715 [Clostridium sp.]|nr:hypothetical protein [Clostridium sp.]
MNKITVGKLFELYLDTLKMCSEDTKLLPDDLIGYNIFEEFIIGITSFLAPVSLERLIDNGLIDEQIYNDSEYLRALVLELDGTAEWNVSSFRNSESWNEIIKLSDKIKKIIGDKWTEQDLLKIYQL